MKKPVIGIIPTFNLPNPNNDPYQDQSKFVTMYSQKIRESGGIPIGLTEENLVDYAAICDGYLWPGGGKILKTFYWVIVDCIQNHKPLLGICLGMQAIVTYFNILDDQKKSPEKDLNEIYEINKKENTYLIPLEDASLHNHYVTKNVETIEAARHAIKIQKNSFLFHIYQTESLMGASMHTIVVPRVAPPLKVVATTHDDIIEAIEYHENGNSILGVQWHPEIEKNNKIFEWLVYSCNKYLKLVNFNNKISNRFNYNIVEYNSLYPKCINDSNLEELTKMSWLEFKKFLATKGYNAEVESAYRTEKIQQEIFNDIAQKEGLEYAKNHVSLPGYSEHELGLAIDVCAKIDDDWHYGYDKMLDDFYICLKENCANYGFIIRYPKNKETITKYTFEPWHIRYINNIKIAHYIMEHNLTLEEFLEEEESLCPKLQK